MYESNTDINNAFKALGHKTRTDVMDEIKKNKEGLTLKNLQEIFKIPIKTMFFHVSIMKKAKLFKSRKKNGSIYLILNKKKMKLIEKTIKIWSE